MELPSSLPKLQVHFEVEVNSSNHVRHGRDALVLLTNSYSGKLTVLSWVLQTKV